MRKVRNYLRFFLLVFLTLTFDAMGQSSNPINQIALHEIGVSFGSDGTAGNRKIEWHGNCGRGKFTYYGIPSQDSNPFTPTLPVARANGSDLLLDPDKRIGNHDIWLSRTGCWNPEERFVFMPPYTTFKRGEDINVDNSKPISVYRNILFFEPTGNKNLALIPNATPLPVQKPVPGPYDEPLEASGTGASSFLIPNDRLLMPHPLCTNLTDEADDYYSPTGVKLGDMTKGGHLKNLFEKQDIDRRVYTDGSMPRCVIEDYVDDVDDFCQEYLDDTNSLISKLGNASPILNDYLGNRYKAQRYFFNFDEFCWDQEGSPSQIFYAFSPYEHWMPLAIRSSNQADAVDNAGNPIVNWGSHDRDDFSGQSQTYWATDIRRPTFTKYAERTVYELTPDTNVHTQFSLEEYGYRERPIRRIDYAFNPNNIYDPSSANITPQELLLTENIGRKEKMYRCLKTYIEQWAFEGDKGSIYLDQNEYAIRTGVGNDASMCQWVAYYDVSENFKDRNHFKKIMLDYVSDSSKGMDFKKSFSIDHDFASNDPNGLRELGCHELDDTGFGDAKCFVSPNPLATLTSLDTQNTFGFPRKHGMRPEAFDYFNFLTFSALPAPKVGVDATRSLSEKYNITHNVELSGGGVGISGLNNLGVPISIEKMTDVYGKLLDLGNPTSNLAINRINFAKRECKTAIPPQIWNDVIDMNSIVIPQPGNSPRGCDFERGARLINNIIVDAGDGPIGDFLDIIGGFGLDILYLPILASVNGADPLGRKYRHSLTTIVDAPILSTVTPIPSLPVMGLGYQYENLLPPYIVNNQTSPSPLGFGEFRDNMHRAAGAKSMPYHVVQSASGNRNMFDDTTMGMIVIDERSGATDLKGRDWVNQSWPAASCMHSILLGPTLTYGQYPYLNNGGFDDIKSDPDDDDAKEEYIFDSWKTYDDIRLDYLAGGTYDYSNYSFDMKDFDGATERKFGGFRLYTTPRNGELAYYYKWLPSKWSVGLGLSSAFWCEFELPYFPYFVGAKEVEHNRGKFALGVGVNKTANTHRIGDISAFLNINGQKLGVDIPPVVPRPLERDSKPRLEYYRVERIRDACGPFGVRSTWVDYERNVGKNADENYKFFDWFIGDVSDVQTPPANYMKGALDINKDQYYHLDTRCSGWIDMYNRKTNDPKAIGWRLARFDYEFMKSFLECTGPYKETHPSVCNYNDPEFQFNQFQSACQSIFAFLTIEMAEAFGNACYDACASIPIIGGGIADSCKKACIDVYKQLPATPFASDCIFGGGEMFGCYTFCEGRKVVEQVTDNVARALDFSSRGDHTHDWDDTIKYPRNGFQADDPDLDESPGFETWKSNSVKINKFWLRNAGASHEVAGDEPYGFWCKCTEDKNGLDLDASNKSKTTRCREDYCTCEQHVLLPSRQLINLAFGAALLVTWPKAIQWEEDYPTDNSKIYDVALEVALITAQASILPVSFCADYGPFRRWIQCFYQARASACPVLTRDVSDSIPYSSTKDPFLVDKKAKDNVPENTQKRQSFNVCTDGVPTGHGDEDVEGFIRWSLEEPNHLARIPVWFESGAAGFAHEDFIFQSQVRDWESPFMELAVPFPIDLVSRHCKVWGVRKVDEGDGEVLVDACVSEDVDGFEVTATASGVNRGFTDPINHRQKMGTGFYTKNENVDGEYPDNLSEIRQREGLGYSQIVYYNAADTLGGEPPTDEFEITSPLFKTTFLRTRDTRKISAVVPSPACIFADTDPNGTLKCDSKKYQELYYKYIKGLYAVSAAFSYREKPEEPAPPTQISDPNETDPNNPNYHGTDRQNVHPRAQDKIVGPRGCDIGGWWEMMLYQARCIRWHRLNCICDYDKTFAKGNDVNYALRRAGAKFDVVGPTIVGARYQTEIKPEQDGVIYSVREDAERKISGEAKSGILPGNNSKRTDNRILPKYKVDPTTGRPLLVTEINGNAIDTKAEYRPDVVTSKTPVFYPIKDRGIVGPEFSILTADADRTDWVDDNGHKILGLDEVRVGDLVVWDEKIFEPSTGLDVGYPRHIAYVEEVERIPSTNGKVVMSFKVAEMNWGKLYDSCGNTNKWGVETTRIIHRPTCASDVTSCEYDYTAVDSNPLDAEPTPGTIDQYADCRNADWYHCVEKYWDQVKIYRPYVNDDGDYNSSTMDAAYSGSSSNTVACDTLADYPRPISANRIHEVATGLFEGDPNATPPVNAVHTPPDIDLLKTDGRYDSKKVREYLQIAYRDGTLELNFILYETSLWKLLVTTTDFGKYYNDEVDEFLFNVLKGAADTCDPLPSMRENYYKVLDDVRDLTGVVK